MDARNRIAHYLGTAALAVGGLGGCNALDDRGTSLVPQQSVFDGMDNTAKERAKNETTYKSARGQAPDGPKAPEGLLKLAPEVTPASLSPSPSASPSLGVDLFRDRAVKVAAYIGTDTVITDDEVLQMVRQRARDFVQLTGSERELKEREVYKEELRKVIERELVIVEMLTRLKKNKKESVIEELKDHADKSAQRRMTDYRKANKFATEEEFVEVLKQQGLTYKGIRRQLERDALSGVYLEQTLKDKVKQITLSDLWDYYQSHPKEFAVEDRVKWLDLFVSFRRFNSPEDAKKFADHTWRQAQNGGDFAALVEKFGQGDSNLRKGEGVGEKRGEIQPPELEKVLFEMDAGQVSALLQTATGYHLVKVVERDRAGAKPFDEKVQIECRERLNRQVQKVEYEKMMDELWRKYRPKVIE